MTPDDAGPYRTPSDLAVVDEHTFETSTRGVFVASIAIALVLVAACFFAGNRTTTLPIEEQVVKLAEQPERFDEFIQQYGQYHRGGPHVLLGNGKVEFITDSEAPETMAGGNVESIGSTSDVNPYGLWGHLGSRSADAKTENGVRSD